MHAEAGEEAVYIWHASLDAPIPVACEGWLDRDERRRAQGRRFEVDRARFVASHALLRAVLGKAIGVAPWDVSFNQNEYRKPELAAACHSGTPRVHFNLAHSGSRALVAVAYGRRVGVDIEIVARQYEELREVTQRFSERERLAIDRLPPREATEAFYRCWVRKEALLKGIGIGLLGNVGTFSVDICSSASQQITLPLESGAAWTLLTLDHVDEPFKYMAALAVEGAPLPIVQREWSWE